VAGVVVLAAPFPPQDAQNVMEKQIRSTEPVLRTDLLAQHCENRSNSTIITAIL
jgi:hypothetical protein